jgi:transcriptional regulator with XRE-family HTH domain
MPSRTELGDAIRAWRERLTPASAGLPAGGERRVPGLRREELALLAGISVDYLVRLEQGRSARPSTPVLAALARALRLDGGERELLYRAAGAAPPPSGELPREVPRGIRLMVDRMTDTPVAVFSAAWDLIESNALWDALFGVGDQRTGAHNLIWWHFGAEEEPRAGVVLRDAEQTDAFEREMVSDLRRAAERYPDDRAVAELVAGLREANPRFAELWSSYVVAARAPGRKTVLHPDLGPIEIQGDVLSVDGSDLRIVICTAEPGTRDGEALQELRRRIARGAGAVAS